MKAGGLIEAITTAVVLFVIWEVLLTYGTYLKAKPAPTTMELIRRYGYPAEAHTVETEDGYIITIFRIPHGKNQLDQTNGSKEPIFLQHGSFSSSDSFVALGPNISLGFQLADLGYDVWIGNIRGTKYGLNHVTLKTSDPRFWDFSCDETGAYDLSAVVDHILNVTNNVQLSYVGHSMGASLAFGLCSVKTEYNDKISVIIALAPGVSGAKGTSIRNKAAKLILTVYATWLLKIGHGAFFPVNDGLINAVHPYCDPQHFYSFLCVLFYRVGGPSSTFNKANMPAITATVSTPSKKLVAHIGQIASTGKFHQYISPGQELIQYPLNRVTVPIAFFYSKDDYIVHPESVEVTSKLFPNVISVNKIPHDSFNHLDFVFSKAATDLVYKEMFKIIKRFEKQVCKAKNETD